MKGLIGKKVGMTSMFMEDGRNVPCTILEMGPCVITQVKTEDTDGYNAVQMGYGERKEKRVTKALAGHYKKAGVAAAEKVAEFRDFDLDVNAGISITVDIFKEDDWVDVEGRTKGKGFQGVVKRHGFSGVGQSTHGQHNRLRAPGSIGASSYPSRVFKGMRMAGRMGNDKVKVMDLRVLKIIPEKNLMLVKGAVPGHKGSYVIVHD